MISLLSTRSFAVALAIMASLAIAACSKSEPQTPTQQQRNAPPAANMPSAMDHSAMGTEFAGHVVGPNAPMTVAKADVSGAFGSGKPVSVTLHLIDMMTGKPMGPDNFELAHTKKIHVLGVDPSLTDYSHSHPLPGATAGDWSFEFTPKFNRPYRLWLDLKPVGGAQTYVMITLNEKGSPAPVEKALSLTAFVADINATLDFDAPLVAGRPAMGRLEIWRGGRPFAALEPVMGAYGHIVGISEDWTSIAHVHPMGTEPTKASDRGGPAIDFHLEPKRAGFLKLFAQIQVDGHDVFLPFAVNVARPDDK